MMMNYINLHIDINIYINIQATRQWLWHCTDC